MSIRIKFLIPFLLLFILMKAFIHLSWLPNLVQQELEKEREKELHFMEVYIGSLTPSLLTGDLASLYKTLERTIYKRSEWVDIVVYNGNGDQIFPLEPVTFAFHDGHMEISSEIIVAGERLGTIRADLDEELLKQRVMEPVSVLEMTFLWAGLLLLLVGILFVEITMLRPIKELKSSAKRLASGDYDTELPIASKDEIGYLISTFDGMRTELKKREKDLQSARDFSNAIVDYAGCLIVVLDTDGRIIQLNRAGLDMMGYEEWEVVGQSVFELFVAQQESHGVHDIFNVLTVNDHAEKHLNTHENAWLTKSGDEVMFAWSNASITDENGNVKYVVAIGLDITEKHRLEQELNTVMEHLQFSNKKLKKYFDVIDKNVFTSTTDLHGTILYVSKAFCRISGYSEEELIGNNHRIVRHSDMPSSIYKSLWETVQAGKEWQGEIKNKRKDGSFYWVDVSVLPNFNDNGEIDSYTAVRQDITDRKRIEELAITDSMTTLYNRRYFDENLDKEIRRARRTKSLLVFIMFDVDHFKQYNDTYGHLKGDEVLKRVSAVLKKSLKRPSDFAFRLGGEEFGILAEGLDKEKAYHFAEAIRYNVEQLRIEHENNSASQYVTISLGVKVVSFDDEVSAEMVVKAADDALYKAKELGRNQVHMS